MGKKKKNYLDKPQDENLELKDQSEVVVDENDLLKNKIDPDNEAFNDFNPGPVWHISVLASVLIFLIIVYKVYFAFFAS